MSEPDAVVVGAGPNGLAAAIVIAQIGRKVVVFESTPTEAGDERLTLHMLHDDGGPVVKGVDFKDLADVGMVQCGGGARTARAHGDRRAAQLGGI